MLIIFLLFSFLISGKLVILHFSPKAGQKLKLFAVLAASKVVDSVRMTLLATRMPNNLILRSQFWIKILN